MRFVALLIAQLRAAPAVSATNADIGGWVRLSGYSAEHETGGVIPNGRSFDDRRWLTMTGVTRAEVDEVVSAGLATWRGEDLVIHGYDLDGEQKVRACRENGKSGGRPPKTQTKPNGKPSGNQTVSLSKTKRVTKTKPLSSPLRTSPSPSGPIPSLPDQEKIGEGGEPPAAAVLLPPFDLFYEKAESGSNHKGTRQEALEEYVRQGRPPTDLLEKQWAAYLASLGDGHSMKISTWLSKRGWEETWERPLTHNEKVVRDWAGAMFREGREHVAERAAAKPGRANAKPWVPPNVPCQFHSLTDERGYFNRGKRAPDPNPDCPECERIWSAQRQRYCHLHQDPRARNKRAIHHDERCPECKHVEALSRPTTSEDATPVGDLLREAGS